MAAAPGGGAQSAGAGVIGGVGTRSAPYPPELSLLRSARVSPFPRDVSG